MFELAVKPNKVQADAVTDKTLKEESSQRQFGDKFAIFGKIIPVNEKQAFIKSVKAVNYRRDPNNPDKALRTPPPTIKGYQVSKKDQVENYDQNSNLVIPPTDPSQDTYLIYQKSKSSLRNDSIKVNKQVKDKGQQNKQQNSIEQNNFSNNSGHYLTGDENNQQINEKVLRKTRFFGFGGSKKQNNSTKNLNEENVDQVQKKSRISENKTDRRSEKYDSSLKNQQKSNKNDHKKPNGHDQYKNKQAKLTTPPVVLNKETKIPPKTLVAILKIVDDEENDKLLTKFEFQGLQGEIIHFDNLKQVIEIYSYDGYKLKDIVNEKNEQQINSDDLDKLAFGTFQNENVEFKVSLVRKKILLTAENATGKIDSKELIFRTNLTIHFSGAGDNTPKDIVENAV